ncbi:hypothetical protein INT47_008261 [Mucor saturninus]|uniref:PROP1-like PPR domain-containing protein n=1 Tax=Mucor saturninus TaxID=64648 RepID=A0A8H7RED2_9FUNG|nr:hypothetical protein INT47_008261 [Mucor saturninus]
MVHMRCQHLHSEVVHTQRLWRAFLSTCQTRPVSSLATRSSKVSSFLNEIDALDQQKMTARRRIPVHVSNEVNKQLPTTDLFTLHAHLQNNEYEEAWKLLDTSARDLTHIPHSTAHLLLTSLYTQIETNLRRLPLDFGKLQRLYFGRLETLAGLVHQRHIPLWDNVEFCKVLQMYGDLDQIKRAESIFRNLPHYCSSPVTVEHYNTLLSIHVRRFKHMDEISQKRSLSKLKTLEMEMTRKGLINTTSYNMLLAAQVKSHHLQAAEKIYEKIQTPDRSTFHILLNGYLKESRNTREKQLTNTWMERMLESGIVPNKKTFICVLDGLSDQAIRHARMKETHDLKSTIHCISNLYKVMLQLGHKPDTQVVNTLLKSYTASNQSQQIQDIMATLDLPEKKSGCGNCGCGSAKAKEAAAQAAEAAEKKKIKIKPDTYTFNMLIKYHLDNNASDQAFQMYDTMVTLDFDPDTVTYGCFIHYYAGQGQVEEALKYYHVMQRKGIPTNNYIYNTLLDCSLKNPQQANLITPHLRHMLASGNASLDSVSHNILLSRHKTEEKDGDHDPTGFDGWASLIDFHSTSGSPSTRTYNTILQTAGPFYKRSVPMLDAMIQSLDTSNLRPDVYTFALSLRNAAWQGNMISAERIFKEMTDSGIQPNLFVFSHLIYGYARLGKMDKASDILRGMSVAPYNILPTPINYAPLIKGYAENAEFEKAFTLFRDMLDKGITADLVIYTILAQVFLDSGNEKRAIELLEGIRKGGIPADAASLTLLAEAYGREGNTKQLEMIYTQLKENKWMDAKATTTLLKAHQKNPANAWKLWNDLKKEEHAFTIYHYNALLSCFSTETKAWYPVSKLVYQELKEGHVQADAYTFDLLVWGAFSVSDFETVRGLWHDMKEAKPELIRTYYAIMTAMVDNRQLETAEKVYRHYQTLPNPPPNSSTVWVEMINTLAKNHGFLSL